MKNFFTFLKGLDKYFILVVFLAAALRFSYITYNPPSLNWDEVSHGYNAYSILTTGKDEWGVAFPIIFRAYGDYKLPVYIYLTTIPEKLFGLNAFAVRLPSVLAGIGTVIFTYYLTLELFKKKNLAVLASFLVAVEPWSLFLSRGAFEANLSLFFIVSGIYFFLKSLRKAGSLVTSVILLGLSVWTYNSTRVFVPLILAVLIFLYRGELLAIFRKNKALFFSSLSILVFFFIPMFVQLLQPVGQARYGKVSIIDSGAIAKIDAARASSKLPSLLNRAINNKVTYFATSFLKNWISHYSVGFLFSKGGSNYQFSIPGRGIIYWPDVLPIAVGLLWLVIKRSRENIVLLAWFILASIPSAVTNEAPQVLRAITMLPTPMIITGIGISEVAGWLNRKAKISVTLVTAFYAVLIFGFLENYLTDYFTNYRMNYSWSWQYGYEQVVDYVRAHYSEYDKIITTKNYGEPHEFFLFFLSWSPAKYRNDPFSIRFFQSDWYWVDRFDKFYFVNDWQIPHDLGIFVLESRRETVDCVSTATKCLLITSPGNYPKGWKKLTTINFLNGLPAFDILNNSR